MSVRWAFNVSKWNPTFSDILMATSCIQQEEKERLIKFVFKKDFKASLVGRLLIRKFIHESTEIAYKDIVVKRDERGKPFFVPPNSGVKSINFNVSHQGDFCVLAGEIGDGIIMGVDVMKLEYSGGKSLSEFFRIMSRQFTAKEWETIRYSGSEKAQLSMFCRLWCLKESYVKALGVGITINLQSINFKVNQPNLDVKSTVTSTELFVNDEKVDWIFQESLINDEHCVAVALDQNTIPPAFEHQTMFKELNFENLIQGAASVLAKDEEYANKFFDKI